ncbi:MAG: hypothetical protein AAF429_06700 [Pseudomonadota bacterium]
MRILLPILLLVFSFPAQACLIAYTEQSAQELRWKSKRVVVDAQCSLTNGGVLDNIELDSAVSLGEGRFYQTVGIDRKSKVLVGDCNTREVTVLLAPHTLGDDTSCGPELEFKDLVGERSVLSLTAGEDLHELVALAKAKGARELNPINEFFQFKINYGDEERHKVGRKDRFDLLCGCKIFYPESKGAK